MRTWVALVALVVGCSEPGTVDLSATGQDGGAPPLLGDGGFVPEPDQDARISGFGDSGSDAGEQVAVDAGTDTGVDAGPCYAPEGIDTSVIPLECDVCPASGCLPIIWSAASSGGTVSGQPSIVAATAVLSTDLYELRQRFDVSDETQAVLVTDGELFEHLHHGAPLAPGRELELDREPWTEASTSLPRPGNTAVPSYMRIVALVTPGAVRFTWTMHRAPD